MEENLTNSNKKIIKELIKNSKILNHFIKKTNLSDEYELFSIKLVLRCFLIIWTMPSNEESIKKYLTDLLNLSEIELEKTLNLFIQYKHDYVDYLNSKKEVNY
jgi:hypothetical protein